MGEHGRQINDPGRLVDRRGLYGGDFMLTESFAYDIKSGRQRGIAEGVLTLPRPRPVRMVAVSDFSGLTRSVR